MTFVRDTSQDDTKDRLDNMPETSKVREHRGVEWFLHE